MTIESGHRPLAYRPEVDGLRAVAVVSVLIYHADQAWLPGGFVGVDIFFVISGYLISRIVLGEMDRQTFSMAGFWVRRVRRIVPALFVMLAVTAVAGAILLSPVAFARLGRAIVLNIVPASNFDLLARSDDYFDPASLTMPLIHTWSLSLEEQFYLVYPPFLWLAHRLLRGRVMPILIAGALLSIGLAVWAEPRHPNVAFYMLPTRSWELLVGAIVARAGPFVLGPRARQAAAMAGLAAIVAGFAYAPRHAAPWPATAPAVLGAALFIATAEARRWPGRLLAAPPLVAIGLISYSLYLWHQPVFALARTNGLHTPQGVDFVPLSALSIGLAYLSWRFIERPFRDRRRLPAARTFALLGAGGAALAVAGLAIAKAKGLPQRFPPAIATVAVASEDLAIRFRHCQLHWLKRECVIEPDRPIAVAVLGDSHAMAVFGGLADAARRHQVGVAAFWAGACPPALDFYDERSPFRRCRAVARDAVSQAIRLPAIRTVLIAARWTDEIERTPFDNREGGVEPPDPRQMNEPVAQLRSRMRAGLLAEIGLLKRAGKRVMLIGPIPEAGWNVPANLRTAWLIGRTPAPDTSLAVFERRQAGALALLADISRRSGAPLLLPHRVLCSEATGRCRTAEGFRPYYWDDDHLNQLGATKVIDAFEGAIF